MAFVEVRVQFAMSNIDNKTRISEQGWILNFKGSLECGRVG